MWFMGKLTGEAQRAKAGLLRRVERHVRQELFDVLAD